jgi:hypothetical protein
VGETEVEVDQVRVGVELPLKDLLISIGLAYNVGEWGGVRAVILSNPR